MTEERKIPGFFVASALYKATSQAALDTDMSVSEFLRTLLLASPAVQEAALKASVDLSDVPTHKARGGYRERRKSEHADHLPKIETPAEPVAAPVVQQRQPAPAAWTGKTVPKPPAAHATTPRRGAAEDYEE